MSVYDSHKKYIKIGTYKRYGRCCNLHCRYFHWVAIRDIKAGEVFTSGIDGGAIITYCDILNEDFVVDGCTPDQRRNFPYDPSQTPPKCGFKWIEVEV